MGWFGDSEKEKLVNEIAKSKIKKQEFIEFLGGKGLYIKDSDDWDEIKGIVDKSAKVSLKSLKEFIISKQQKRKEIKEQKKAEFKEALENDTGRKGSLFEKKTASWLKKRYGGETKQNQFFKGKIATRPYEVDVVLIKEGFLGFGGYNVWVECKNRDGSIKRTDINKTITSFEDVNNGDNDGLTFDHILFVSTSTFDTDALAFAKNKEVCCVLYKDEKFKILVEPNW